MQGNKIVLFLPVAVMAGLFIAGYFALSGNETYSHEELAETAELDYYWTDREEGSPNGYELTVSWRWGEYPEDGIAGDDFIELQTEDQEAAEKLQKTLEDGSVQLTSGDEVTFASDEVEATAEGVLLRFPNEMQQELVLGAQGEAEFRFAEEDLPDFAVRYIHTWQDGSVDLSSTTTLEQALEDSAITQWWSKAVSVTEF
ncbi:hypothetical protein [Salisediminibacterium halotolerans]|uniref:hypothetical protein n=1 Tax=Salisediminibacterium halotolerans TaxID=517425 RepID=UPI000EAFD081|nr:hypothetical protein [Salisediminibacterium halotolerans]RLJ78106.1 hypothetical protein BCL39_0572 [Actinophytocola xinjiangensis]RPE88556.1 hypothetical protein EDD67_0887 [Salisediminibacterium halotolerans]TWG37083.1 hypothetical protein BCL52_0571 [Salisediminibacterium halotolerans]GEL06938.1 hypothetical protein SHA02_03540 [Salisediminibacterium halotolerans]